MYEVWSPSASWDVIPLRVTRSRLSRCGTAKEGEVALASLPVTELKLDRAFVAAMGGSSRSAAIVTSTLQLAHALGLVLVAEGVEDEQTLHALAALGCDTVQGYHISRPLPAAAFDAWLDARAVAAR